MSTPLGRGHSQSKGKRVWGSVDAWRVASKDSGWGPDGFTAHKVRQGLSPPGLQWVDGPSGLEGLYVWRSLLSL